MTAVSQELRDRIIRAGFAFEPPEHARPKKGLCPYVDTRDPKTGENVASTFVFEGKAYEIRYLPGCFYPFIYACG